MIDRLSPLLFAAACALAPASASATWSSPQSLGAHVALGELSCATASVGKVVCAARRNLAQLQTNVFDGARWSGWTPVAGFVSSAPSCADDGAGKVLCAAGGVGYQLVATVFDGSAFGPLAAAPGGAIVSAPSCAALSAGNVVCLARSKNGNMTSAAHGAAGWSAFTAIATPIFSVPSCAPDRIGNAICGFLDGTQTLTFMRYDGAAWTAPLAFGAGGQGGRPTCSELGLAGQVFCSNRGGDGRIYSYRYFGGGWNTVQWSGPYIANSLPAAQSTVSCGLFGVGQIVCGVEALADSALWTVQFDATANSLSTWTKVGGALLGAPACTALSAGQAVCALMGVDNLATSVTGQ